MASDWPPGSHGNSGLTDGIFKLKSWYLIEVNPWRVNLSKVWTISEPLELYSFIIDSATVLWKILEFIASHHTLDSFHSFDNSGRIKHWSVRFVSKFIYRYLGQKILDIRFLKIWCKHKRYDFFCHLYSFKWHTKNIKAIMFLAHKLKRLPFCFSTANAPFSGQKVRCKTNQSLSYTEPGKTQHRWNRSGQLTQFLVTFFLVLLWFCWEKTVQQCWHICSNPYRVHCKCGNWHKCGSCRQWRASWSCSSRSWVFQSSI